MTRLMLSSILCLSLCASSWAQSKGTKYALLIGVNKYDPTQLHNLSFAENDVKALAEVLVKKSGFSPKNVYVMTTASGARNLRLAPTTKNIRRMLAGLSRICDKEDTFAFAFSGHGAQFAKERESYLCPMDADLTNRKTLIHLKDEIYRRLERDCKAATKLLFIDACKGDPLARAARSRPTIDLQKLNSPQQTKLPKGIAAFFSCRAGQQAFEASELRHGVFFHFVAEGLRGKAANRNGEITLMGLSSFVRAEVRSYTFRQLRELQSPTLVSETNQEIVLTKPPNQKK